MVPLWIELKKGLEPTPRTPTTSTCQTGTNTIRGRKGVEAMTRRRKGPVKTYIVVTLKVREALKKNGESLDLVQTSPDPPPPPARFGLLNWYIFYCLFGLNRPWNIFWTKLIFFPHKSGLTLRKFCVLPLCLYYKAKLHSKGNENSKCETYLPKK